MVVRHSVSAKRINNFMNLDEVDETLDFVPEQTLLKDIAFTMNYIIGVRMPPAGGGLYEPLVLGPAVLESFEQPSADFTSVGAKIKSTLREHGQNGKDATIERVFATATTVAYQLSDNTVLFGGAFQNQERSYVAPPKLAEGEYFVELTTGIHHYTGLTNLGNVYAFGENLLDQCDTPKNLSKAAHVFACGFQTYTTDENNQLLQKWGHKGYLFGTDKNGADIFQRIVNGSKMTMTIGGVAVLISTFIGIIVGCVAGYFGGKVDIALMRVTEVFAAIPFLPFAMILSSIMSHMPWSENAKIFLLMCILGVLSWTGLARLVRGQVLVARENEYVTAAKAMGVTDVFDFHKADFSPLVDFDRFDKAVAVTQVQHAACVKVDEKGCEAAAFTAVRADAQSAAPEDLPVVEMNLNRPFAFMITGVDGLPLFLGTVNTLK